MMDFHIEKEWRILENGSNIHIYPTQKILQLEEARICGIFITVKRSLGSNITLPLHFIKFWEVWSERCQCTIPNEGFYKEVGKCCLYLAIICLHLYHSEQNFINSSWDNILFILLQMIWQPLNKHSYHSLSDFRN